jgi:hypothetical protein
VRSGHHRDHRQRSAPVPLRVATSAAAAIFNTFSRFGAFGPFAPDRTVSRPRAFFYDAKRIPAVQVRRVSWGEGRGSGHREWVSGALGRHHPDEGQHDLLPGRSTEFSATIYRLAFTRWRHMQALELDNVVVVSGHHDVRFPGRR